MNPANVLQRMLLTDFTAPDPGVGGTFSPEKHDCVLQLTPTTVGGARYIMPPTTAGQRLRITCRASGSNTAVVSFREAGGSTDLAFTQNGDTSVTLTDDDVMELIAIKVDTNLRWRLLASDGTSLVNTKTVTRTIQLPLNSFVLWTTNHGAAIGAYTGSPGFGFVDYNTSKDMGIAWAGTNVNAIATSVARPSDITAATTMNLKLALGKTGNTDTTATIDCNVYPAAAGDENNSDIQGTAAQVVPYDSGDVIGGILTFTIPEASMLAYPSVMNIIITPGAHANDVEVLSAAWLEYTATLSLAVN